MARPKPIERMTEGKAAYAASQPLYEVLRKGVHSVNYQTKYLTHARDAVQKVHVKLRDSNDENNIAQHQYYIDAAVKAWKSALINYRQIFDELASVNGPDATEGKAAAPNYEEIQAIAQSVEAAQKIAKKCRSATAASRSKGSAPTPDSEQEDDEVEGHGGNDAVDQSMSPEVATSAAMQTPEGSTSERISTAATSLKRPAPEDETLAASTKIKQRKTIQRTPDQQAKYDLQKEGFHARKAKSDAEVRTTSDARGAEIPLGTSAAPVGSYATLGSEEKKAWQTEKGKLRREKGAAARAAKKSKKSVASETAGDGAVPGSDRKDTGAGDAESEAPVPPQKSSADAGGEGEPMTAPSEPAISKVEYEDVSAEVAARLKAKAEKKLAKAAKKRKRESEVSLQEVQSIVGAPAEKPKKKKPKTEETAVKREMPIESIGSTTEEPKRKKAKSDAQAGECATAAAVSLVDKRKNGDEVEAAQEPAKKRKKARHH